MSLKSRIEKLERELNSLINEVNSSSGGGTSYTDAEIKVKYENNPDTNEYSDAEKIIVNNTSGTNTGDQDISGISTNAGNISTLQSEQTIQDNAIALNTAKVSNVSHPLVETAVPLGAVFTDTVYDDTAIQAEVDLNTAKVGVTTEEANEPLVTQLDAEAGTSTTEYSWSPERVAQAIAALASGGGSAPTENVILEGTKTASQNINGIEGFETDLTWDVVLQDTAELTTFVDGDSVITFTNAGWINLHASAYITNGTTNNRTMIGLARKHFASGGIFKYGYWGDMQYNRDDATAYDSSGGVMSQNMIYVDPGDYFIIRTRIFDDGTSASTQYLDTTYSKIRIAQIVF